MFKSVKTIAISSACLGSAVLFSGCDVNEGDVASARDNVVQEQQETDQARKDADHAMMKKRMS